MSHLAPSVDLNARAIDAIFADLDRADAPGAVVGIAVGGQPVYRKGFGLANLELPVILSPAMRLRIGSTTKHFTCFAYLLLCEEGRASIDDPVGKHLSDVHPTVRQVTMRQLMGNVSGLRDVYDLCWQFCASALHVASDALYGLYRDIDDVNDIPGASWIYNNGGFLLLGSAIERITGKSLETVMLERIFQPVGMHDTLLRRSDHDFVPNSATLHMTDSTGRFNRSYLWTDQAGEGGIVSTVDDMLRWLTHMQAPRIGSVQTWALMQEPQKLTNGTWTGYGLGLMMGRYRGIATLSHGGGVLGGNCQMLKVPAAALDIVVMVNRHDVLAMTLANRVLEACLPDLDPIEETAIGSVAQGVFRSPSTGRVIQLLVRDGQQIGSIDGFDWPLTRDSEGVLQHVPIWSSLKQSIKVLGDPAEPRAIQLSDFGNVDELTAVSAADGALARPIAGIYRAESARTEARFNMTDDGARMTTTGPFGSTQFRLEPVAEGIWRVQCDEPWPPGGIVSFERGQAAFCFSSSRTRMLRFHRCD